MKSRKEIQNNLTVYEGFEDWEINQRVRRNREKFERACRQQGIYLPSDGELDRWFKERPVASPRKSTVVHRPPVAQDEIVDVYEDGSQVVRLPGTDVSVLPEMPQAGGEEV